MSSHLTRITPACAGSRSPQPLPLVVPRITPPARGALRPGNRGGGQARITPACAGSTTSTAPTPAPAPDHPRLRGEHGCHLTFSTAGNGSPPPARGALPQQWKRHTMPGITPRLRGEHAAQFATELSKMGSPPPARGAPEDQRLDLRVLRITPACAGSTRTPRRTTWSPADHPRLRGEHWKLQPGDNRVLGSPPPARGARGSRATSAARSRITPACAGSTPLYPPSAYRAPDHPRLRGEHSWIDPARSCTSGSPPPARGARCRPGPGGLADRITPACAGSTTRHRSASRSPTDHPRLRGEHPLGRRSTAPSGGSPPPARGAPQGRRRRVHVLRITPACAGSTSPPRTCGAGCGDHPRLRGEHVHPARTLRRSRGSPPPARGALPRCLRRHPACRITPRLRGEHGFWPILSATNRGSPPPARGAQRHQRFLGVDVGITPACAGSTTIASAVHAVLQDHPRLRGEHSGRSERRR